MSLTLDLPSDLVTALETEAADHRLPLSEYVVRLLADGRGEKPQPQTGAELVEYWKREGLVGTRSEITDSAEHARLVRGESTRRVRD
jgi:hypothetical protein